MTPRKHFEKKPFENIMGKGENAGNQHFLLFIHPSNMDVLCYHPWWAGGVPHSLSGAYAYASYGYETSWMDRSHQGRVQCTRTITLACLIFELLPFIYFHT